MPRPGGPPFGPAEAPRSGCLLQDHVGVGAADAEGGDRRPAGPAVAARTGSVSSRTCPADQSTLRARLVHVQACVGQRAVPSAIDHLDHPGDPGRGLAVADVGLDRAAASGRPARCGPARRWREGPVPRSGRRAGCRCRAPRRRPRQRAAARPPASAGRMTRCWDGPLGAVSPLEAPSELTGGARGPRASTRCPLPRRASDSRSSRTTAARPRHQPVPSAAGGERLAPAVQRPAPAGGRTRRTVPGVAMTVAPAATRQRGTHPPRSA